MNIKAGYMSSLRKKLYFHGFHVMAEPPIAFKVKVNIKFFYVQHEILSTGIFYLVQNLEKSDTFWQICLTDTFGWRKIA